MNGMPAGWGFLPNVVAGKPTKTYRKDWPSIRRAITRLAASGYATAQGTDRRKLADIMRTFDLDKATAVRCLVIAKGGKQPGGRGWKRLRAELSTGYAQGDNLDVKLHKW